MVVRAAYQNVCTYIWPLSEINSVLCLFVLNVLFLFNAHKYIYTSKQKEDPSFQEQ